MCVVAAILWAVLWAGYIATHGPTMFDQQGKVLTLTWYDISKFVAFALLGFALGIMNLRTAQSAHSGRLGDIGYVLTLIGFLLVIAGALGFWLVPWGSYAADIRETVLFRSLSILMFVSPALLGAGMIIFGVDMLRNRTLSRGNWLPVLIGLAAFSPFLLWTNVGFIFGALWGLLGVIMIVEPAADAAAA